MPGGDQAQAPPIVHAIGGALGTALAVLLFYPLERARIELQAQAQRRSVDVSSDDDDVVVNDELESVQANLNVNVTLNDNDSTEQTPPPTTVALDSSWESAEMVLDPQEQGDDTVGHDESSAVTPEDSATPSVSWSMRSSSSSNEASTTATNPSTAAAKSKSKRLGLIDCLIKLHSKQALYQGLAPVVTTIATSQFVFFYLNAMAKKVIVAPARQKGKPTAILSLVTSCLAGIVNVLLTNPLWVVNMAIVTGNTTTSNLWKELKGMAQEKGLQHLWSGTSASLLLVSNPVIQFFCYEQFKQARLVASNNQRRSGPVAVFGKDRSSTAMADRIALSPTEAFLVGALSKGVATISTYPLQLTQTVLRLDKVHYYHGTWDCLKKLVEDRGILDGLFTGMRAKLLQTVLTAAFTFLTYEQILSAVHTALIRHAMAHPRK
jgi:adenine nucleotide transporter 17